MPLWKEYVHFLLKTKATQKLNRVISTLLQTHPNFPDFWLIAAYIELNMKANMFAGRRLLLQSLRNNDSSEFLHIEYFKYELAVLEKLK